MRLSASPPSVPVHVGNGGPVARRLLGEREQTIATEVLEDRFTCLDKEVVVGHGHRLALGDRFRHRQGDRVSGHRGVAANGNLPVHPNVQRQALEQARLDAEGSQDGRRPDALR